MAATIPRRDAWSRAFAWLLLPFGAYFILKHAIPRLEVSEAAYGEYYWPRRFWLLAHTAAGLAATLLGPLQFSARLRARWPHVHRWSGRVYLSAVVVAGSCAYVLAFTSQISALYRWGLVLGATLWLATGTTAYVAARQRRFGEHRAWMVRNYAVTYFFIVFFAAYDLAQYLGYTDVVALAGPLVLVCLAVPLATAEALLRARRRPG